MSSTISPPLFSALLGAILTAAVILFVVMSAVFLFHWRRYGMNTRAISVAKTVYFLVSAGLFATAVLLFLVLTNSHA